MHRHQVESKPTRRRKDSASLFPFYGAGGRRAPALERRSQLICVDRLEDEGIGTGASGDELVSRPVDQQDSPGSVGFIDLASYPPDDGHPSHAAHLHVDDDRVRSLLHHETRRQSWVAYLLDVPLTDGQPGPNFVGYP